MTTKPLTNDQISQLETVPIFETVAPDVLRWVVRRVEFEHYIGEDHHLEEVGIERMNPPPGSEWEVLTAERLATVPMGQRLWAAIEGHAEPQIVVLTEFGFRENDQGMGGDFFDPVYITHIMPFTTPEMPK